MDQLAALDDFWTSDHIPVANNVDTWAASDAGSPIAMALPPGAFPLLTSRFVSSLILAKHGQRTAKPSPLAKSQAFGQAKPALEQQQQQQLGPAEPSNKLFIGNIGHWVTEEELHCWFQKFGQVTMAKVGGLVGVLGWAGLGLS